MTPLYTVSRCRKDDITLYGKIHGSKNANITLCGVNMYPGMWYVITNNHDGEVTCPKCLKIMERSAS